MKKYARRDQKALAVWAADCAKRVLPLFEKACPKDDRPRQAIEAGRIWARTGEFKMAVIRGASLGAHAAARGVEGNDAACFAARAAGQAVGTAHVAQHAFGAALYALKAIVANDPANAEKAAAKERTWQSRHLPTRLRRQIMERMIIEKRSKGIFIKLIKGEGF